VLSASGWRGADDRFGDRPIARAALRLAIVFVASGRPID
jgi:hypothetical protein